MTGDLSPARIPTATYRLQFHAGFRFCEAREILDYLQGLGISDIYSSPVFQAPPDSTHGYDVADHNRINPAVGDASDFRAYVDEIRQRGMGHILDFVPNHMGIGQSLNAWWMSVLEEGPASPYANFFDIDWHPSKQELDNKVLLPILGDRYGKVLENGDFKLSFDDGKFSLQYFQTRLPLNPRSYSLILQRLPQAHSAIAIDTAEIAPVLRLLEGTAGDPTSFNGLHELLEAQSYRLSYWRAAAEEINYRRFFDINTLAALRVEIPEVFEAAHGLVFELLARGDVTGLRIDHIDGLWDPREYLRHVQERYGILAGRELYLLVEKILDPTREYLPADWPVHGTTGYEFANQVALLMVRGSSAKSMTTTYKKFTGLTTDFDDLVYEKKILTMRMALSSEITALGRLLDDLSEMHRHFRDFTRNTLTTAVREVIACFSVYRTYITPDQEASAEDTKVILHAILAARRRNPTIEKAVFDFLRGVLLMRLPDYLSADEREAHIRFVRKFQQCTGPVTAKGLEDTAFYIYNRLVALNEVGGDPKLFSMETPDFHRLNEERLARSPHTLLATSTHDTKRSEDVRMRLVALSEFAEEWRVAVGSWSKLNAKHRTELDDQRAPLRNEEYLLYQTLIGSWPLGSSRPPDYTQRIQQYMLKALKEAKLTSSWVEPHTEWEAAVSSFVENILDENVSPTFVADLARFVAEVAPIGALNSLSETALKCTVPGVPDFYQGMETWDFSLVDPDNRRPVDYAHRRELCTRESDAESLVRDWQSGEIKLHVIKRLLNLRRDNTEFFLHADYAPLEVRGACAESVVAFSRSWKSSHLLVVVPRLTRALGNFPMAEVWRDTCVCTPETGPLTSVFGSAVPVTSGAERRLCDLLSDFPVGVFFSSQA